MSLGGSGNVRFLSSFSLTLGPFSGFKHSASSSQTEVPYNIHMCRRDIMNGYWIYWQLKKESVIG